MSKQKIFYAPDFGLRHHPPSTKTFKESFDDIRHLNRKLIEDCRAVVGLPPAETDQEAQNKQANRYEVSIGKFPNCPHFYLTIYDGNERAFEQKFNSAIDAEREAKKWLRQQRIKVSDVDWSS
jgi:hypothetical protein